MTPIKVVASQQFIKALKEHQAAKKGRFKKYFDMIKIINSSNSLSKS